ncbi:purine-nucleoside phosphorylase [Amycolatopsis suaedae]|uniref:Purine nucleoside permease n=1 Tax=Amycolatopsis suaedae TaxID=2510978 RepID=A0A4Q7J3P7_9PSEU|nr:purine nucleoside permease [Amycolatopsis suaedae]RZQ61266.1 purine nucleoside permease [Amycolatopsis suaedae]
MSVTTETKKALPLRVLVVTMYDGPDPARRLESRLWLAGGRFDREVAVSGLPAESPVVRYDERGVGLVVTGAGEANAAASLTALVHSGHFDLRGTYILVAGISGIDPAQGTLGTAVWTDFAVHGGAAHHIDARELPDGWDSGYVALGADRPGAPPAWGLGHEVFELDPRFLRAAYRLTADVDLADSEQAAALRARYPEAPANAAPMVRIGSTMSENTFWSGPLLSQRARRWVSVFTGGRGQYCTTQMEDNATLLVLWRAAAAGLVDAARVAILRVGSNFDQAPPGGRPQDAFGANDCWDLAAENAYRVGSVVVQDIVERWTVWEHGVPASGESRRPPPT